MVTDDSSENETTMLKLKQKGQNYQSFFTRKGLRHPEIQYIVDAMHQILYNTMFFTY